MNGRVGGHAGIAEHGTDDCRVLCCLVCFPLVLFPMPVRLPFMTLIQRNREICRLFIFGANIKDITRKFHISSDQVKWIAYKSQTGGDWAIRGEAIRQEISKRNDLNRKWRPADLIASLQLSTRARSALLYYYDWGGIKKTSLQEFMDLIALENPIPDHLFGCTAVMKIRNLGRLSFWLILHRLSTLDLGGNAKKEWERKMGTLRKYGRRRDLPRFIQERTSHHPIMAA